MIKRLELKNFKCFEALDIKLSGLNLLSGINSMGKSTVIQSLLLLRQTYEQGNLKKGINLNGEYIEFGTGADLLYCNAVDDEIGIALTDEKDRRAAWRIEYTPGAGFLASNLAGPKTEGEAVGWFPLFGTGFVYLSAERLGPRKSYGKPWFDVRERAQMGTHGEYAVHYLFENQDQRVENEAVLHLEEESRNLQEQTERWLGEISPGVRLSFEDYGHAGLMGLQVRQTGIPGQVISGFTPVNVGFGITYILPVVLALLKARHGDMLILENPEAHLHPRGQRKMGELIALAAAGGVQVLLETHSDHVLNGIRLSVKNKKIRPETVALSFFIKDSTMNTIIKHPVIFEDGRLSCWPDGFFDEWDKAMDEMSAVFLHTEPISRL